MLRRFATFSRCPNPRSYLVLLLTVVAYGSVNGVVFSLLPLMGADMGMSAAQITVTGSAAALMVFLVSPWWGRRSDQWGRRRSILIGVTGYCFSALLLATVFTLSRTGWFSNSAIYAGLFSSRLLQAFLIAAMLPAITAYVIDITTPEERAVGLSQTGAAHGLGAIAGPSLVTLAAWHVLMPLYVALGLALLVAVLVTLFLQEPQRIAHAKTSAGTAPQRLSYFDPRYRHLLLIGMTVFMGMSVITQTMGFYLPHLLQLSSTAAAKPLGLTQGMMAMTMVFGQLVLVRRLNWPPVRLLASGVPVILCGFVLLACASALWELRVAAVLIGLGLGLSGPGFSAAVSVSVEPHEQGAVAGFLAACPALGYVIGPFGAGLLYGVDPRLPFAVMALLLACLLPVLWYALRRHARSGLP